MKSLLFASKFGILGAKLLTGAAIIKATPFVLPIACAVVCVGATIAGAKYLSKKLSSKESDDDLLYQCVDLEDDCADRNGISNDADIKEIE